MRKKSRRTILRRIFKPAWLYFLLKKLTPLSHNFGSSRGEPIDRYYIEKFLSENREKIQGHCLEVEDNFYTKKLAGDLIKSDILDINRTNQKANIYADLRNIPEIKDATYNCIILTQVLQFINDYESAIKESYRILKPNGCLLVTLPFISRVDGRAGVDGDYWRFTTVSAKYIFGKYFKKPEVKSWGNVLSGLGFWVGEAQEEMFKKELDYNDPDFPVIISVKCTK